VTLSVALQAVTRGTSAAGCGCANRHPRHGEAAVLLIVKLRIKLRKPKKADLYNGASRHLDLMPQTQCTLSHPKKVSTSTHFRLVGRGS
jgi:hypothetical protein